MGKPFLAIRRGNLPPREAVQQKPLSLSTCPTVVVRTRWTGFCQQSPGVIADRTAERARRYLSGAELSDEGG